jgi:antirestriction protein ArdC
MPASTSAPGRGDLYSQVTQRLIAALEAGTIPWRKPWDPAAGRPASMSTGRPYRGVNALLLGLAAAERGYQSRWWGTYRQIAELGGQVRRGEHSTLVVFFAQHQIPGEPDPGGQNGQDTATPAKTVPVLRYFRVFNACQADHLPARFTAAETAGPELAGQPQQVLAGYLTASGPRLVHACGATPHYSPGRDQIVLPAPGQFRLNRPGITQFDHFGSGRYAREELVAEIAAAMLCSATGVTTETSLRDDSAAYIAGWLDALRGDRRLVVIAASQAERAADRILEPQRQAQPGTAPGAERDEAVPTAATTRTRLAAQWAASPRPHLAAEPEAGA